MQMYKKGYHNFRISNDTFNPFHQTIKQFPHKKYTSPNIFSKIVNQQPPHQFPPATSQEPHQQTIKQKTHNLHYASLFKRIHRHLKKDTHDCLND